MSELGSCQCDHQEGVECQCGTHATPRSKGWECSRCRRILNPCSLTCNCGQNRPPALEADSHCRCSHAAHERPGWECPRCHRSLNPHTAQCSCGQKNWPKAPGTAQ